MSYEAGISKLKFKNYTPAMNDDLIKKSKVNEDCCSMDYFDIADTTDLEDSPTYCGWEMRNSCIEYDLYRFSTKIDTTQRIISRKELKKLLKEWKIFYKNINAVNNKYEKRSEEGYYDKMHEAGFNETDIKTYYFLYRLKKYLMKNKVKYFVWWLSY